MIDARKPKGRICGLEWDEIAALQQRLDARPTIDTTKPGDYGADPLGDGTFRMVPSGDVVDYAERCRRLNQNP